MTQESNIGDYIQEYRKNKIQNPNTGITKTMTVGAKSQEYFECVFTVFIWYC